MQKKHKTGNSYSNVRCQCLYGADGRIYILPQRLKGTKSIKVLTEEVVAERTGQITYLSDFSIAAHGIERDDIVVGDGEIAGDDLQLGENTSRISRGLWSSESSCEQADGDKQGAKGVNHGERKISSGV
jgi:hypothetical protein